MANHTSNKIQRLLSPQSIAFVGGKIAEMAINRCIEMGYEGDLWSVNPNRESVSNLPCYSSVDELSRVPDAVFISVNRERTIETVKKLSDMGAGGCVCYAAGFAEMGKEGQQLQLDLIDAAGDMPLIGPNTFGYVNYLDSCALWPYLFGGTQTSSGGAFISQSGNIAMNVTMNQRSVNFTHVIGTGNQAILGQGNLIHALLEDDRVKTIGMYVEGFDDIESFCQAAEVALQKGVPIIILKVGRTEASALQTSTHTSSISGSDELYDLLFAKLGVIRVHSLNQLLETMKILQYSEPIQGNNIFSLSCSGGEAAMIADLASDYDLETPPFSDAQILDLQKQFPNFVTVSNPFDYNTSIWAKREAQELCFTSAMQGDHDAALLIFDFPTIISKEVDEWIIALDAFITAHKKTGKPSFLICTISELLPESVRNKAIENGVIPLQGFDDGLFALSSAIKYHGYRRNISVPILFPRFASVPSELESKSITFNEQESKNRLVEYGLTIPGAESGTAMEAVDIANRIGYPVVLKAMGANFTHKTEMGAVILNLGNATEVESAIKSISEAASSNDQCVDELLIEEMIDCVVAELIVGIKRDEQFGAVLVIGSGGILVELLSDCASLLLPTDRDTITKAINSLTIAKILNGYRGQNAGDMEGLVNAILNISKFAEDNWSTLLEMDVNPLLVLPEGKGVVVADALICMEQTKAKNIN
jgi:acetate---CoA ligase (ADP-forming)